MKFKYDIVRENLYRSFENGAHENTKERTKILDGYPSESSSKPCSRMCCIAKDLYFKVETGDRLYMS